MRVHPSCGAEHLLLARQSDGHQRAALRHFLLPPRAGHRQECGAQCVDAARHQCVVHVAVRARSPKVHQSRFRGQVQLGAQRDGRRVGQHIRHRLRGCQLQSLPGASLLQRAAQRTGRYRSRFGGSGRRTVGRQRHPFQLHHLNARRRQQPMHRGVVLRRQFVRRLRSHKAEGGLQRRGNVSGENVQVQFDVCQRASALFFDKIGGKGGARNRVEAGFGQHHVGQLCYRLCQHGAPCLVGK